MISINVTGVDQVRATLYRIGKQLANKALTQTAVQIETYVEQEAAKHNKKGALVRSIYKTRLADGSWEIGHDPRVAPHALFVHWGTKKHDIRPKNKKTLRWASGGAFHFAKVVHHPGNKPDKWLERAATTAPQMFAAHVAQQVAQFNQG